MIVPLTVSALVTIAEGFQRVPVEQKFQFFSILAGILTPEYIDPNVTQGFLDMALEAKTGETGFDFAFL